jgi:hypothetical protein
MKGECKSTGPWFLRWGTRASYAVVIGTVSLPRLMRRSATFRVLGVAASVVGHAAVADWFAPLLVLTRRGRPRRGKARRAE